MQPSEIIRRDAFQWLLGAGAFAIALWFFLVWSDHQLSTSRGEEELGATIRELRTAQHALPTDAIDPRQGAAHLSPKNYEVDALVQAHALKFESSHEEHGSEGHNPYTGH